MSGEFTTRLSRKVLIAALSIAGSFWLSKHSSTALLIGQQTETDVQSPEIIITSPEAPLQILSTWIQNAAPQTFRLVLQVQNQNEKGIRAYAINWYVATSKKQNGSSQFLNITQRAFVWQPSEIRSIEVNDSLDDPIRSVKLTIDFIEFTDGTSWGSDSENSRDLLKGQREGAKFEKQRLREFIQAKGSEALTSALQLEKAMTAEPSIPTDRSVKWQEGFRYGVSAVRRRAREAIASGKQEQIREELNRPFDTAEDGVQR